MAKQDNLELEHRVRRLGGLTRKEIGQYMGISVTRVKQIEQRGLEKLQVALEAEGLGTWEQVVEQLLEVQ